MKKEVLLQLILLLTVLVISIIFFRTYFVDDKITRVPENELRESSSTELGKKNIIHDIEYISEDNRGNKYIIKSEFSEVDENIPELVLMKNVKATLSRLNSNPIIIYAENALYDGRSHNTQFFTNVFVKFDDQNISSNNLDLIVEESFIKIFNNVIYSNLNTKLIADKIEIDIITKNSKIYMNNDPDMVKITKK
tara:strand:- start:3345 stop:3926 length:582 start_codon:yes stop_codon:yes gene_type:complete